MKIHSLQKQVRDAMFHEQWDYVLKHRRKLPCKKDPNRDPNEPCFDCEVYAAIENILLRRFHDAAERTPIKSLVEDILARENV